MTTMDALTASQTLAQFAQRLTFDALPASVVGRAKACLFDHFENVLQAPADRRIAAAIHSVPKASGLACPIWGSGERTDPLNGAFVNGVIGAIVPRNDIHPASAGHAGSVVIPALLAAASERAVSGADFIAAMIVGYEVIARVGAVLLRPGLSSHFRPTALTAPLGAAAAVARLYGLSAAQIATAIELATHSAFGLNEWARAGTGEDAFHSGWGARNGFAAALLAKGGAAGAPQALEGASGLFAAYGVLDRLSRLGEGLGTIFEIENVQHKPVGACLMVQAPSQLAEALVRERPIEPQAIQRIEVTVSEQAKAYPGCDNAGPVRTVLESIMSIQFSVAAVVGAGGISQPLWSDFDNPATNALIGKVHLRTDPAFTSAFPQKQGAAVSIFLADGSVRQEASSDYRSMGIDEILARFAETAAKTVPKEQAQRLVYDIENLERMTSAGLMQEALAQAL